MVVSDFQLSGYGDALTDILGSVGTLGTAAASIVSSVEGKAQTVPVSATPPTLVMPKPTPFYETPLGIAAIGGGLFLTLAVLVVIAKKKK